jgi:hypothetical protein
VLSFALSGCADFTVTRVTPGNANYVKGVRYYLPKPFLLAVPQSNGTVQVSVVYLPDTSKEYAIDSSSGLFSSYSVQALTDPSGILTGVQYSADTTAVGAQAAATAGAVVAQVYNYRAAQASAVQTQVNSAQTALITAQANYQAAAAQLNADTQNAASVTPTVVATIIPADNAAVAQALAKLQIQQTALLQVEATNQAATATAGAATPITPTAPAAGSLTPSPWTAPVALDLPERFGPVLYAIDDTVDCNGCERLRLDAVTTTFSGHDSDADLVQDATKEFKPGPAQQAFQTVVIQPPLIAVPVAPFKPSQKWAIFVFSQQVYDLKNVVVTASGQAYLPAPTIKWDTVAQITVDIGNLPPGGYELVVTYTYAGTWDRNAQKLPAKQIVPFTVVEDPTKEDPKRAVP